MICQMGLATFSCLLVDYGYGVGGVPPGLLAGQSFKAGGVEVVVF